MSNHLNFTPIFKGLRLITGLASLALLVFSGMAHAAYTFQNASGTWTQTDYSYSDPQYITSVTNSNYSAVYWGAPLTTSGQKSLVFQNNANTAPVTPGSAFAIGWLTHANNAIAGVTNIANVSLSLQLSLAGYSAVNFNYNFGIAQGPGTNDIQTSYKDTLTFSPVGSTQFFLGEQAYSFELLGFYKASDNNTYSTLIVPDTLTASQIPLYARITAVPTPVPVPAALWLLGSGLLGLAGFARRQRAA
ncbi:hypothetical protein SCD_n01300 [Sulfuricella denitrificans skB26]|uniref:Ice-binding protein C-terminal domain-containing protein n=2 Tax=Sulfuricella denitrificans TaxID=649841 RepID=S6B397_SULDS|nr:hypothetical protein SCD_n01300 [Sulfuricella denitrificans skB26]